MAPEMIPGMIEQGYRAIAVAFDVWGFANLVNSGIQQGREYAQKTGDVKGTAVPNGKSEANGTVPVVEKVVANGK
jgi:4-hydroxy-2-oxoheptanedioate aldolase